MGQYVSIDKMSPCSLALKEFAYPVKRKFLIKRINHRFRFEWERVNVLLGFSEVHISWEIGEDTEPGIYRIKHFGHYKYILGGVFPYEGTTRHFTVSD